MASPKTTFRFEATLLRPKELHEERPWTFLILPKEASDTLPRRGRTTVEGSLNGFSFRATLEPDGQLSHWLKVAESLRVAAGAEAGQAVSVEMSALEVEPEPLVPTDFEDALGEAPEAREVWDSTTTIARVDWIHWIESAKQSKTREKRIRDACEMLAEGKKRVCCFDPSGFYSKALRAPVAASLQDDGEKDGIKAKRRKRTSSVKSSRR